MKVDREKLVAGLSTVLPALNVTSITPAFQCVHFAEDGTLTGMDGQIVIETALEEPGNPKLNCLCPVTQMLHLLKHLKAKEVTVDMDGTNVVIKGKRGALKGTFATVEDYPPLEVSIIDKPYETGIKDLLEGFNLLRYHVSRDPADVPYCGIHIAGDTLYATDKFRIASYKLDDAPFDKDVVLSKKYIEILLKNREEIQSIGLSVDGDRVEAFLYDGTTITTALLEGKYEDVASMFPSGDEKFDYIEIADGLREVLDRHIGFIKGVKAAERFMEVTVEGQTCSLVSRDAEQAVLAEDLQLVNPIEGKISFSINPLFWKDVSSEVGTFNYCDGMILFVTERMAYLCRAAEDVVVG
jgi:DNA polymerase III sliding clamp (beta) subunit (PCNA family)